MTNSPENLPPGQSGNSPSSKGKGSRRPSERGGSSWGLWVILAAFAGAILLLSYSRATPRSTETLEFSRFQEQIEGGLLSPDNVFDLRIGISNLSFRNLPRELESSSKNPTKHTVVPIRSMPDGSRDKLAELLTQHHIRYTYDDNPTEWYQLAYISLLTVFFVVMMVMVFRRLGGTGSAIAFGRSRGKMYAQEELGITFTDVAGIDEAVEELREVVEFLQNPGKYQALGGRIPRGVLLVGPPGTGKTLLAKAVAGEAGVPFFGLSGSDFVEMFVGVGAARVRDMFQQAAQRSPAIIFIDELDALGKVRGSGALGGQDEREQTLNALLVEMDGFASDQSVIVMGATNRPETLDPALLRPGRFDRHVLVDRPDVRGREAILRVHASKVKTDDSVDLQRLAKLTPGFVGADLANLVNEAALLAARKDRTAVTRAEFEEGIDRIVAGLEKQTRIIPEEEKRRVAWHEIGHALVACTLPHVDPVHKVSIIPRGLGALGYTLHRPEEDRNLHTKTELQNLICVLLGGIAAEEIVFQENSTGAANDLQRATDLARRMVTEFGMSPKLGRVHYSESTRSPFLDSVRMGGEHAHSEETLREIDLEIRRIIDAAYSVAHEVLISRRPVMERLAQQLLEHEVMDAEQLQAILNEFPAAPHVNPGTYGTPTPSPHDPTVANSPPAALG